MGNPLFGKFNNGGVQSSNPALNALQIANAFKQMQSDPSKITDLLLEKNRITKEQYNELQKFGGDPESIAKYLIQNGTMTQQDLNNMQNIIPKS